MVDTKLMRMPTIEEQLSAMAAEIASLKKTVAQVQPRNVAYIPPFCTLGENTDVAPTAVLYAADEAHAISIGSRTKILRGAEWTGPVSIGSGCYVNRDSYIRVNVTIGNNVNIGPFVSLMTDDHEIGDSGRRAGKNKFPPIVVEDGVWIGANVTVVGGVTIGAGAVVAAGALVNGDVAPNTLVGGVPARHIKDLP